jgi:hypothetical protein
MRSGIERLLSIRTGPRPDPIPTEKSLGWWVHAPWIVVALIVAAGELSLPYHDLGLLACGAAAAAIALPALRGGALEGYRAFHLCGALIALAGFHDAETAGGYVLPAGLVITGVLLGEAAATYITPAVASLAGRVPWRFENAYRQQALHFGVVGLMASLFFVLLGPSPVYRILGVALLPLALRTHSANLLALDSARLLWSGAAAANAVALLLFVPAFGAPAAAWGFAAGEVVLFLGSAVLIADRTGATPFPRPRAAVAAGFVLLLGPIALPGGAFLFLTVLTVLGLMAGGYVLYRRRPWEAWLARRAAMRSAAPPSP